MFMFHNALMLGLIAIAMGVMLVVWSCRNQGEGVKMAGFFGWLIVVLAILGMICSSYYSFSYWQQGFYQGPLGGPSMTPGKNVNAGNQVGKKH